jgi:hypothetical protein
MWSLSARPARIYLLRVNAPASPVKGLVCSMSQLALFANFEKPTESPTMPFGKTCQAPSAATLAETLLLSSKRWSTSGRVTLRGECWTVASQEWLNDAEECFLSQILEESAPQKYWLSPKACAGILRRAEKRGKELPRPLERALTNVASREP